MTSRPGTILRAPLHRPAFLRAIVFAGLVGSGLTATVPISAGYAAPNTAANTATQTQGTPIRAAVQSVGADAGFGWETVSTTIGRQLDDDATVLRQVFGTLNRKELTFGNGELDDLSSQVQKAQKSTQDAINQIQSYDNITDSFLKVLGTNATDKEDPSITAQRQQMLQNSQTVKSALIRARLYNLQAQQLTTAINARRSRLQQAALSERTASPVSPRFWTALLTERAENRSSLHPGGVLADWLYLLIGSALTLLAIGLSSPLTLHLLRRCGARFYQTHEGTSIDTPATSEGTETDSTSASTTNISVTEALAASIITITLNGLLEAVIATIIWAIWAAAALPGGGGPIASVIGETLPVCGFIIGAGLPVFGRKGVIAGGSPGERRALRGVDWILALSILLLNLLRAFQTQDTFGQTLQILLEIAFSLGINLCTIDTFRRLRNESDTRGFAPSALGASILLMLVTVVAILLGYVAFAFSINGWLLSFGTGVAIVVLLALCWRDALDRLFSPDTLLSRRLSQVGLSQHRLSQIGVVLSGVGNVLLLLVLFTIAQSDGSFSVNDIVNRLHLLFVGNTIHGVTFSLDTVILCAALALTAHYAIRQTRGWLRDRLFPTTRLDIGSRTSILSIFTYCAWILVGLGLLSIAGVSVQNMTWVVSALSVGIGFGLQSIVQNFVSGIILMAERPVRVGDVVEIAGTRGDIKRISIRATDIGLGDGSTMIVPNSQFITTSVKNATLGGATAVLTLTFKVPTTTDPDKARAMLLEVVAHRDEVLGTPQPKVRVNAITYGRLSMTLSVTILSARDSSAVQDAILFDVFRRFYAEDIAITTA